MNNKEHLALFILGVATLGITFLLLIALSDKETGGISVIDQHMQTSPVQAAVDPGTRAPEPPAEYAAAVPEARSPKPPSMEAFDREIEETFSKAAEYLGRGRFEEKEHIELLERLEFYVGMSSIRPENKKAAQKLIKDMGRLLTLKESVARQVKLAGQISAVETDVQIHLASGARDEAEARKLSERLESLYAVRGLSAKQNRQLRTSLAALKKAYEAPHDTSVASSAPASSAGVGAPEAAKPAAPEKNTPEAPKSRVVAKAEPGPVAKAPARASAPGKAGQPESRAVIKKYNKVMTYIARYFVVKKYDRQKHDELTADLHEIAKNSDALKAEEQQRLKETIAKMKRIDMRFRKDQ